MKIGIHTLAFPIALVLCAAGFGPAARAQVLLSDDFDRADSTVIANGWSEYGWYSSGTLYSVDAAFIAGGQLRFSHDLRGRNVDAGLVRPLPAVCGVKVSATVEWVNGNRNVGLAFDMNAAGGGLSYDGLQLALAPEYRGSDLIDIANGGPSVARRLAAFDLSVRNKVEWIVGHDCSTEVRMWPLGTARPALPLATSPPVSPIPRADPHFEVMAVGGTGCCDYLPYDLRVDNLVVVQLPAMPPACSAVQALPVVLWPPNGKWVNVQLHGAESAGPLTITRVTQDEPVEGPGAGNTAPDAAVRPSVPIEGVALRAERAGNGDGRVYRVEYAAGVGAAACTGFVKVGVPAARNAAAVDSGQLYDSLQR